MTNIEIQNIEPIYSLFYTFFCCFPNKIKMFNKKNGKGGNI